MSCRHNDGAHFRHFPEHPLIGIGRIEFGFFVAQIPLFPRFEGKHKLQQGRAQMRQVELFLLPVQAIPADHKPLIAGRSRSQRNAPHTFGDSYRHFNTLFLMYLGHEVGRNALNVDHRFGERPGGGYHSHNSINWNPFMPRDLKHPGIIQGQGKGDLWAGRWRSRR